MTGASRGIGAAVAIAAARAGADVAVGYKSAASQAHQVVREIQNLGRGAASFKADVSRPGQAARLVRAVESEFGRIDGLVNNAGVVSYVPFLELDTREWERVLRTDLSSAYFCSQSVLPGMIERRNGSIVMVSSRVGQVGWPRLAHYAAAKAGLLGLTKSLAREFGPMGIRVNAVAPAATKTDMGDLAAEGEEGRARLRELLIGRFPEAQEVATSVVFLLSDASAVYIGQTLCPNGGAYLT